MWSNLAHEMTAEFRGLCAEEVMGNSFTLFVMHLGCSCLFSSHFPIENSDVRLICSKSWKNYMTCGTK
jgi:hypothetical protein